MPDFSSWVPRSMLWHTDHLCVAFLNRPILWLAFVKQFQEFTLMDNHGIQFFFFPPLLINQLTFGRKKNKWKSSFNPLWKWRTWLKVRCSLFLLGKTFTVHGSLYTGCYSIWGFNVVAGDLAQSILLTLNEWAMILLYIFFSASALHLSSVNFIHLKERLCDWRCTFGIWCTSQIFFPFDPVLHGFIWASTSASPVCRHVIALIELFCSESLGTTLLGSV